MKTKIVCLLILLSTLACSADLIVTEDDADVSHDGRKVEVLQVTMESGAITSRGFIDATITGYENWVRTAFFVKTNGAYALTFEEDNEIKYVSQYDNQYCLLSTKRIRSKLLLDDVCTFIKFQKGSRALTSCQIQLYDAYSAPSEELLVQQSIPYERIVYRVDDSYFTTALLMLPPNYTTDGDSVPLVLWDSGDGSFRDWDNYQGGSYEGRLRGLQYLRDQGFAVLEIYSWGSNHYKKHSGCGGRSAMPIPTHLATHEKGVEYVTSRYNIDTNKVFEISKSGSGKISLYWAMYKPSFNLKAIYAFAPVFDDLNFVGWGMQGYRQALFEELGLEGTEETDFFLNGRPYDYDVAYKKENNLNISLSNSWQMHKPLGRSFIEKNAEKFKRVSVDWMGVEGISLEQLVSDTHRYSEIFWEGYNRHYNDETNSFYFSWDDRSLPASHSNCYTRFDLVRRNSGIPLTVIMSPTDEQTPYWNALEVIKQMQNGGADAKMITLETGGHSGPDLSTGGSTVVTDVTTRLGVHYDNVSIGWYIAVEDIYKKYLTESDADNVQ